MPKNGSVKAYAHQLTLAQHREAGTTLLEVRGEVMQLVDLLRQHYGRADAKSRHAAKLLTAVEALRSLLSRAALTEHYAEAPAQLITVYYPPQVSP